MFVYGLILKQHSSPACAVGDFTHLGLFLGRCGLLIVHAWEESGRKATLFVPGGPHLAVYSH